MDTWDQVLRYGKIVYSIVPWALALFGVHAWAYNRYPKYYFLVLRIFSKWRDTKWNVSCRFVYESPQKMYPIIEEILRSRYKSNYHRPVNMTNKKLYQCGHYNLMITDDSDMGEHSLGEVWFTISQLNVTLKNAEEYLRDLRELFHEIERKTSPKLTDFGMDVYFPKNVNPFFGLMIQRLGTDNVDEFQCVFPVSVLVPKEYEPTDTKYKLRVYKEKISINESSIDTLEEVALRALLLR